MNGTLSVVQHCVCSCDNVTFKVTRLIKNNKEKTSQTSKISVPFYCIKFQPRKII